jgi:hypothetical protein
MSRVVLNEGCLKVYTGAFSSLGLFGTLRETRLMVVGVLVVCRHILGSL